MEAEECSSCESGWTTYLASPMHDGGDSDMEVEANDEEEDDDNDGNSDESDGGNEGEDNDSMASDASTGTIQLKRGDAKCDPSCAMHDPNPDDGDGSDEDDGLEKVGRSQQLSYSCKVCEVNKMSSRRRGSFSHKEDGATSLHHTSSKVRKTSEK